MRIEFDGKLYDYDPLKIDVLQAMAIWDSTGYGLLDWEKAVRRMEPKALQVMFWCVKQQNGERCELASLNFNLVPFMKALSEAMAAEGDKPEEAAGPKGSEPDLIGISTETSAA